VHVPRIPILKTIVCSFYYLIQFPRFVYTEREKGYLVTSTSNKCDTFSV
jgi:hypothetical protein